jgi:hypothetical protein
VLQSAETKLPIGAARVGSRSPELQWTGPAAATRGSSLISPKVLS